MTAAVGETASGIEGGSLRDRLVAMAPGWQLLATPPGAISTPDALPQDGWRSAPVPGTVALAHDEYALERHPDYDASDWWYRCSFAGSERAAGRQGRHYLCFDGLATLAHVWLNGEPLLQSDNMFHAHRLDVSALLQDKNELLVVFRSLNEAMKRRRPRPRWKTALVAKQRLRWFRTSLLGRISGWSPAVAAVGPWRPIRLERSEGYDVQQLQLLCSADAGAARVRLRAQIELLQEQPAPDEVVVLLGERTLPVAVARDGRTLTLALDTHLSDVALWYPHSHGEPALHDCALLLRSQGGEVQRALGRVGFRELALDRSDGAVRFSVNGRPVFCRGGCWTHHDLISLGDEQLDVALARVRDSGANMLRISGTGVYPSPRFYALCDELGLLVWHDFMFASLDYPTDDPDFRASIVLEAEQQLEQLARHPCIAAYCGGSEVQQQAAMFGASKEHWRHAFFAAGHEPAVPDADAPTLGTLVERLHPGVPYWPSSPCGGDLPFHTGEGISHYFGVGAYRRPLQDVRLARVRFASECLAFSNIPEPQTLQQMRKAIPSGGAMWPHHPAWKQGVPRDANTGWDFEDIRDHYLSELLGQDAARLRFDDPSRYLTLSRAVTGWLMQRCYAEWRSRQSSCGGGLLWFMRDIRPGAGWGVIDAHDRPKAAYYFMRRAWAPRSVALLDRGLDGLLVSIVNETVEPLRASLQLDVYTAGAARSAHGSQEVRVDAFDGVEVSADGLLGFFHDLTHSYRFGPAKHEAVHARLLSEDGATIAEDVYRLRPFREEQARGLQGRIERVGDDLQVHLSAEQMVYDVRVEVRDHLPESNYFVLTPNSERCILLRRVGDSGRSPRGFVEASNMRDTVHLSLSDK